MLDGLFHEKVVLCEGDADCRFYAAVLDAFWKSDEFGCTPDIMFTHCGGKDRMAMPIAALRALDVPVTVAADFDVLRDESTLRKIVEALGGNWSAIRTEWVQVKNAIESKKPELLSEDVKKGIAKVLETVIGAQFPMEAGEAISRIVRRSSPWSIVKQTGKHYVPSGQPTQIYNQLMQDLRKIGLHIVEAGELEGFDRSLGGHGPAWVNQVVQKKLADDPTFEEAREFVRRLVT
jgi:hypothetical protein